MDEMFWEKSPVRRPSKEPPREQLDAFAQLGAGDHEAEIRLLIPIAQKLAAQAGETGVTIADVREEAVKRGILPPLGEGRSLSYLGSLCKRAGLVASKQPPRRSHVEGSHANRHTVWVLPAVARSAA